VEAQIDRRRTLGGQAAESRVGLCTTPLLGWRGGRCTPNHAFLHAPKIGTPLITPLL